MIRELHADVNLHLLPDRVFHAVRRLVSCDHASCNELNPEHRRVLALMDEPEAYDTFSRLLDRFALLMHESPLVRHYSSAPMPSEVRKMTDFLPQDRYHHLSLYNEVYRPLDTEYQIIVPIPARSATVGVALNRKHTDFDERDREILNLFQPHLAQVYHRALGQWRLHCCCPARPSGRRPRSSARCAAG